MTWSRTIVAVAIMIGGVLGCASGTAEAPTEIPRSVFSTPSITASPGLSALLASNGVEGSIATFAPERDEILCSDPNDCAERTSPASTFKIVNAIIALETGVAPDESLVIPWDGVVREIPEWNRDQDLASAFASSCLPCFQDLARRIGLERSRLWVERLGYGNGEVGSLVDRYWLDGPLEISPVEQMGFLRRLEEGRLPIAPRTREIVRELLVRERRGDATLRGKTGWLAPGTTRERGWFVGYATRGGRSTYVAVRLRRGVAVPDDRFRTIRLDLARAALVAVGAYPRE